MELNCPPRGRELTVIQMILPQKPNLLALAWNSPGRQFKTLASQITITEIELHGVPWIFKLKNI